MRTAAGAAPKIERWLSRHSSATSASSWRGSGPPPGRVIAGWGTRQQFTAGQRISRDRDTREGLQETWTIDRRKLESASFDLDEAEGAVVCLSDAGCLIRGALPFDVSARATIHFLRTPLKWGMRWRESSMYL